MGPLGRKASLSAADSDYFFLAEPLLLELDLPELLLLFDPELFDPPDLDAALAMLRTPLQQRPTTVESRHLFRLPVP